MIRSSTGAELGQLKSQQIELKKESTAAAAALPSFSYRPGNGVDITAADKSWGIRFGMEAHLRAIFESGQDAVGRTNGEVMMRRWPQYFLLHRQLSVRNRDDLGYGWFWNRQCQELDQHRHQFHPAARVTPLPPRELESVPADGRHRRRCIHRLQSVTSGSSAVGTQMDYDLLSRNFGPNTGRAGWGYVLNWDDRSLSGIGIPGRIGRYEAAHGQRQ